LTVAIDVASGQARGKNGTFTTPTLIQDGSTVGDNGTNGKKRGSNRAEYLIRRLKRDAAIEDATNHQQAQETFADLQSGEFRSARQAGIHAGIVRVPTALEVAKKDDGSQRNRPGSLTFLAFGLIWFG
jgi:hypothetical protein